MVAISRGTGSQHRGVAVYGAPAVPPRHAAMSCNGCRHVFAALAAAYLGCAIPPIAIQAQNAVFSAKVEAVRVDVLVTDRENGPAFLGLGVADFEVFDN